jgi:DNA polymerase IV
MNKPNGIFKVEPRVESIKAFLQDLNIRKVPGIGPTTEKKLSSFGVKVVGDLVGRFYDFICVLDGLDLIH